MDPTYDPDHHDIPPTDEWDSSTDSGLPTDGADTDEGHTLTEEDSDVDSDDE